MYDLNDYLSNTIKVLQLKNRIIISKLFKTFHIVLFVLLRNFETI